MFYWIQVQEPDRPFDALSSVIPQVLVEVSMVIHHDKVQTDGDCVGSHIGVVELIDVPCRIYGAFL